MKVLFLFGGDARRMKTAGTRQKINIGGKKLWQIQATIAEKAGYEPVFCTNDKIKNGPDTFPAEKTMAESILSFLKIHKENFAIIRGDIILNPNHWNDIPYKKENNSKLGCRIVDEALTTVAYNLGNVWSSFWQIKKSDYMHYEGADWQLLNKICDYRDMKCVMVSDEDFIEIDGYNDILRATCILTNWGLLEPKPSPTTV